MRKKTKPNLIRTQKELDNLFERSERNLCLAVYSVPVKRANSSEISFDLKKPFQIYLNFACSDSIFFNFGLLL